MVIVWFDGVFHPSAPNVVAWSFVVGGFPGEGQSIAASGTTELKAASHGVAEYVGLGSALKFLGESGAKVDELKVLGDTKFILDHLLGKAAGAPELIPFRERCAALLRAMVCPKSAECIPPEQNIEARGLARAAWIGRTGRALPAG